MAIVYNSNNALDEPTDFTTWTTSLSTVTLATGVNNPAGTTDNVYEFRVTTAAGAHLISKAVTAGQKWFSVYLKVVPSLPGESVLIGRGTTNTNRVAYDINPLSGGALTTAGTDITSHSITDVGNGWSLLKINCETVTISTCYLWIGTNTGAASFTPASTVGVYLWGGFAHTADEAYYTITSSPPVIGQRSNWGMRRFTRKNTLFLPT